MLFLCNDDVLVLIFSHILSYFDFNALQLTCIRIQRLVATHCVFCDNIENIFGFSINHTIRKLINTHIKLCMQSQFMAHACNNFIYEFESSKCIFINGSVTPFNSDLLSIVPTINDFRVFAQWWLLGRMILKLINEFRHNLRLICESQIQNDIIMYCVFKAYTWSYIVINTPEYLNESALQHKECVTSFLNVIMCANIERAWVPQLESHTCNEYTPDDKKNIQQLISVVMHFTTGFRKCMNKSLLYKWHQYRRDVTFARKRLCVMEQFSR